MYQISLFYNEASTIQYDNTYQIKLKKKMQNIFKKIFTQEGRFVFMLDSVKYTKIILNQQQYIFLNKY